MSDFQLEDRYLVLKRSDISNYLNGIDKLELECFAEDIANGRMDDGRERDPRYVLVKSSWDNYAHTCNTIEQCVQGTFADPAQEIDQLKARVAELEAVCEGVYRDLSLRAEPHDWDNPKSLKVVNLSDNHWCKLGDVLGETSEHVGMSCDSLILRKQAEAVDRVKFERALVAEVPADDDNHYFVTGFDSCEEQYDDAVDRYAARLRQQADDIETGDEL